MRGLSLFSGIGGLDLAAKANGIEIVGLCEIEPYAVSILQKSFPSVPIFNDIRELKRSDIDGTIDVVFGGFPCQDLSVAGQQRGLEGERSGLWFEMLRVIEEFRPAFILAENVRGAINLALDTVQEGLETEDYEVRTVLVPASAFGAPHRRERLFIVGVRRDVADTYAKRLQRGEFSEAFNGAHVVTSRCCEGAGGGSLWPTPVVHGNNNRKGIGVKSGDGLGTAVRRHLWPTPSATRRGAYTGTVCGSVAKDGKSRTSANGTKWGAPLETAVGSGQLNPDWVEQLMNFPAGWTDIDCEEPEAWAGWPALFGERLWMTLKAGACGMTARTSDRSLEMSTHLSTQTFVAERDHATQYPYEYPRTTTQSKNRAKRLKCLGNAVVPRQAYPFFRAMMILKKLVGGHICSSVAEA